MVVQLATITSYYQVGLPYVRAKAQDYYESLGGGLSSDITGEQPTVSIANLVCT
jgi:hypothetical protein